MDDSGVTMVMLSFDLGSSSFAVLRGIMMGRDDVIGLLNPSFLGLDGGMIETLGPGLSFKFFPSAGVDDPAWVACSSDWPPFLVEKNDKCELFLIAGGMRLHLLVDARGLVGFIILPAGWAGRVVILMKGEGFSSTFVASFPPLTLDFLDPSGNLPELIIFWVINLISELLGGVSSAGLLVVSLLKVVPSLETLTVFVARGIS